MDIKTIQKVLLECYTKGLCVPNVSDDCTESNKCFGMSGITALIVQDYFGGKIGKIHVNGVSHYFNILNDQVVDLTDSQFVREIDYTDYEIMNRDLILTENTKQRYERLKKRLIKKLLTKVDERVHVCKSCGKLVEKFPNDDTVYLGKDHDIVLVGEAPANNGWRKSHKLWCDVNGKVLPSGVILQRLFDIIDRNIFDTTFLESVKCYPLERKSLKTCSKNCKDIMLEQLRILNPKLVITLGKFPTRNLLNFKFNKFGDVVGEFYEVDGFKVLPIYHPSPISPKSYKGNLPVFMKLKEYMDQ